MIGNDQKFFDSGYTSKRYLRLQTEERTQTSISRLFGTVREQALFQSEFGIRTLRFRGQIYGYLEGFRLLDAGKWSYSLLLLVAGMYANDRIGANKSTGMGKYDCKIQELKFNNVTVDVADLLVCLSELVLYQEIQKEHYRHPQEAE